MLCNMLHGPMLAGHLTCLNTHCHLRRPSCCRSRVISIEVPGFPPTGFMQLLSASRCLGPEVFSAVAVKDLSILHRFISKRSEDFMRNRCWHVTHEFPMTVVYLQCTLIFWRMPYDVHGYRENLQQRVIPSMRLEFTGLAGRQWLREVMSTNRSCLTRVAGRPRLDFWDPRASYVDCWTLSVGKEI